ncbi:hypothetical protein ES704_01797 [subsurface metagenome]|jgi:hypothetical protein
MKTLSAIRTTVRQFLRDEFKSGEDYKWQDDELDLHIGDCLAEISERRPYEVKETLTTTASSRELDISSIEDLLEVDKVEFRTGQNPPDYRNCSVFGNTLTLDIDFLPSAGEDVYLYCHKLHQLTEDSSTLSPQIERLLVLGVTARAAIAKAQSHINKMNIGGGRTPAELHRWGVAQLALYRADLRRLARPRTYTEYPKS